ncbi:unnamed protein product [Allacma fusca]|uniref:Protein abrupt-like n=1 Tax=Allacma fusca TaxID=39272 RepID=A0A8J2PDA9_9HEXA|nr:unnamed protein product [Allacma fusca]
MGDDQRYSLRWNDFYANIISAFKTLKESEDFVDVTIACDGKSLKAHQVILSAASPFFRKLLKDNPCQHPIVILKDVRYQDMESLLNFMYHGEVQICQDDLTEFLRTAQTLQVKGLTDVPHISPPRSPRSPAHSATPPPLHIPEVRLENLSDDPSCDSTSKRLTAEDAGGERCQENHNHYNNHSQETHSDTPEAGNEEKETTDHDRVDNHNTDGNETEKRSSNHTSILIQALEQGRQNFDRDRTDNNASKHVPNHPNAMVIDEDSSPDEAEMKYDDKAMDGIESCEELSAHALTEAMRFPAAAALLGFQGLPGFLPGPSSMQNNSSSLDVSRRSLDMLRVRATDPRPCPKCGKIYRSAHTLRTHLEDKHTICPGYRCVLCGTVAKSRNSLHSHMSRQHRGISTKDLPVLPMPAPFDPQLAARLLAKAGIKFPSPDIATGASPTSVRRSGLEVTPILPSDNKPGSPKSGRSGSIPGAPKMDTGTTGSAILDTYLQFIAENSIAFGGPLQYSQRNASHHRSAGGDKSQGHSSEIGDESGEEDP